MAFGRSRFRQIAEDGQHEDVVGKRNESGTAQPVKDGVLGKILEIFKHFKNINLSVYLYIYLSPCLSIFNVQNKSNLLLKCRKKCVGFIDILEYRLLNGAYCLPCLLH